MRVAARSKYPARIAAGKALSKLLAEKYNARVEVEVEGLAHAITIQYDSQRSVMVNWNVPVQVLVNFDEYYYGSDYIKSDREWNEAIEDIKLIVEALMARNGHETILVKRNKEYKLKLELDAGGRIVTLVNPNRPLVTFFSKRKRRNLMRF